MPKLPSVTPKKLLKILQKSGFITVRQKGSHVFLRNPRTNKCTIVPLHNKDLPKGTLKAILKQAEINL